MCVVDAAKYAHIVTSHPVQLAFCFIPQESPTTRLVEDKSQDPFVVQDVTMVSA